MALKNVFGDISLEATQEKRLGGGKSSVTATLSIGGDNIVLTPTSGKALTIFWVYAVTDSSGTSNPIITIKLGSTPIYKMIGGLAHWEPFTGAVDESLVVNLSSSGTNVVCTFHYTEA